MFEFEFLGQYKDAGETLLVFASLGGVLWVILRNAYKLIRNVEKLVESSEKNEKAHESITTELRGHIKMEEDRDAIRDEQMKTIVTEMRPNGGSSMKDVVNATAHKIDEVHTRVAVLEQWKEDRKEIDEAKNSRRRKSTK